MAQGQGDPFGQDRLYMALFSAFFSNMVILFKNTVQIAFSPQGADWLFVPTVCIEKLWTLVL